MLCVVVSKDQNDYIVTYAEECARVYAEEEKYIYPFYVVLNSSTTVNAFYLQEKKPNERMFIYRTAKYNMIYHSH